MPRLAQVHLHIRQLLQQVRRTRIIRRLRLLVLLLQHRQMVLQLRHLRRIRQPRCRISRRVKIRCRLLRKIIRLMRLRLSRDAKRLRKRLRRSTPCADQIQRLHRARPVLRLQRLDGHPRRRSSTLLPRSPRCHLRRQRRLHALKIPDLRIRHLRQVRTLQRLVQRRQPRDHSLGGGTTGTGAVASGRKAVEHRARISLGKIFKNRPRVSGSRGGWCVVVRHVSVWLFVVV